MLSAMASSSVRLLLVRHGEVDANRRFEFVGRRDDELTAHGREQAVALGKTLAPLALDRILSSPLRRALDTALAVAEASGRAPAVDHRLVEQDYGVWEGTTRDEVLAGDEETRHRFQRWLNDPSMAPPEGESLNAVADRVRDLARELLERRPGETVVMVSHVGPIKALICVALGLPLTAMRRFFLDPATISVVDWAETPCLRLYNSHGHLGWAEPRWLEA